METPEVKHSFPTGLIKDADVDDNFNWINPGYRAKLEREFLAARELIRRIRKTPEFDKLPPKLAAAITNHQAMFDGGE